MRAVKGNKEYTIEESQQKGYQDMGFDILDDDGKVIAYGRGKTVSYEEYMKVVREAEALRTKIAQLEAETLAKEAKKADTKKAGE